ncbi:hypothetical protein FKW77_003784 [Venturia effusa]|uniref:NAD(P)-binding protein n=1 Tax=Venturia effusa TaxID=50376 RepID=A0A517LMN9_9PEZI|nr:hypothetical protein FKW77_003784 [Venturia effusa]
MATPECTMKIDFSEEFDAGNLKGKSAIVTGAGGGIGESIARELAKAGVYVTIAELNEENGEAVASSLRDEGFQAQYHKTDVTNWDELVSAFNAAISFSPTKSIDIVIPNAGVASNPLIPWLTNTPEDASGNPLLPAQSVLNINFTAVYNTALLAMYMFKKYPSQPSTSPNSASEEKPSSKHIIFVGSMASYQAMTGVPSYGGTKFGVRGIFKAMRELSPTILGEGRESVRVNMIAPSWIRSGMTGRIVPFLERRNVVVGEPGDCARVVLRMCGDEGVRGRVAAVLGNGGSFDICDDFDGMDGSREIMEAYKNGAFGDHTASGEKKNLDGPKIEDLIPNDHLEKGVEV